MSELKTLQDLVASLACRGDASAVRAFSRVDSRSITYRHLAEQANRFGKRLVRDGVRIGDFVGVLARPSPESIAACLGVVASGATIVPIDTQFPDEVLKHVLKECSPLRIVTTLDLEERLSADSTDVSTRYILDAPVDDERHWLANFEIADGDSTNASREDDVACLFYTSGTTGMPKGVPLTHRNVATQLESIRRMDLVTEGARALMPLPLHHVYPFVIGLLTPLSMGLEIVLPAALTGPQLLRALADGRVTHVIGVPRLYDALLSGLRTRMRDRRWPVRIVFGIAMTVSRTARRWAGLHIGRWLLAPIRKRIAPELIVTASGGAPLEDNAAWELESLGWQVAIGYGLTETSPLITINPPGKVRIGSVGRAIEGTEIRIAPVPDVREPLGEVQVKGRCVFHGYHRRDEETREAFTEDGWFRTGDIGRLDRDGYLHLAGRLSTLIVMAGGENVQPEPLEHRYEQDPLVKEIGVLQRDGHLVALVVPDAKACTGKRPEWIEKQIRSAIAEQARTLPSYQRVSDLAVTHEALARTRLGKIQRHTLAQRYDEIKRVGSQAFSTTGALPIEEMSDRDRGLLDVSEARRVWEWLADHFPDARITPDTSLRLELDIDSLEWVELTEHLHEVSGVELDEQATAGIETIRDLLVQVCEAREQRETVTDTGYLFEEPESFLTDRQRRWLKPLPFGARALTRILYYVNRGLMRMAFRLEVEGIERIPRHGPCIICPSHASYLDPLVISAALSYSRLRETQWVAWWGGVLTNPFVKLLARLAQTVPIEGERAMQSSLAAGAAVLARGHSLVWFPEGERSLSGELRRFKPGIGMLLSHFDLPVVPAYIAGAREALPRGSRRLKFHRVKVIFGDPMKREQLASRGAGSDEFERIAHALRESVSKLAPT